MTALAFARQTLRTLDDETLEQLGALRRRQLDEIDARRKALGWSRERLYTGASVNRRTVERAFSGHNLPEFSTIQKLFRALEAGERAARAAPADGRAGDLKALFDTFCRLSAVAFGLEPDQVVDVKPSDNRPRDKAWLALVRAKHVAAYALVTSDRVSMADAGRLAGVSKQAISDALRAVEERRDDDAEFTRRLLIVVRA